MNQANLRDQLVKYFNDNELNDLCFDLNIDYQNIPGQTKQDKARELITYCQRHHLLDDLTKRCQELRPQQSWKIDDYTLRVSEEKQTQGRKIPTWMMIMIIGIVMIVGGAMVFYLIQRDKFASTPPPIDNIENPSAPTATQPALLASDLATNSIEPTPTFASPTALPLPVQLPDIPTVTMFDSTGNKFQYTILSAQREPLSSDKYLLQLHIRAWTDFMGGMNFWSDSFRLVDGDLRLTPVNSLNEVAKRDETIEGDVEFEIDNTLEEATLVITVGGLNFAGNSEELPLIFPQE